MALMDCTDKLHNRCPLEKTATAYEALGGPFGAFTSSILKRDQPGHGATVTRDSQAFALGNTIKKAWQMCFGFTDTHGLHNNSL